MSANFRNPNFLLPNELNRKLPASGAETGSGLTEDRHSLYSMDFDGTAYVNAENPTELQFTGAFSVSFWMKSNATGNRAMVSKDNNASNPRAFSIERTNAYPGGYFVVYDGTTAYGVYVASSDANYVNLNDNNWHNVVAVYTPSVSVSLFVDGNFIKSNTTNIPASVNFVNDNLNIGRRSQGVNYFYGKIDEVAIFSSALTLSEVQALAKANAPANIMALDKKPVAYYPLGEQARDNTEWQFPNQVLQSQVFDFDGSTDFIDVDTISLGNTFTLSCWVNFDSFSATTGIIFGGGVSYYALYIPNSTTVWAYFNAGSSFTVPALSGWNNLIFTRNGATGELFLNGQSQGTNATYGTNDFDLKFIGCENQGGGTRYYLDGKLSNAAVWNTVLDSANIANIYNNGSPQSSYTTTPTAWYKLNATNTYAGLNPNYSSALSFDGVSGNNIDVGTIASLNSVTEFTASFWSNFDSGQSNDGVIFTNRVDNNNRITIYRYNTSIYFHVNSSGSNQGNVTAPSTGSWTHVVMVYDGSGSANADRLKVYFNGVEQTLSYGGTIPATTGTYSTSYLGARGDGSNEYKGDLSNFSIFNQAISAEDVKYLYNGGTPQTNISFEPTSWYKLDNLTTGIQDSGSASNNGTNNGATAVSSSVAVNQWNFNNVSQSQTPNYSSVLSFDDTNDYIDCGNDSSLQISQNISVSCWFKCTTDGVIISKGQYAGEAGGAGWNYFLKIGAPTATTTTINWSWYTTSSEGSSTGNRIHYLAVAPKDDVTDGNWHNIVATRSSTGSSLWLDGIYIADNGGNLSGDLDYMVNSSQNVTIGTASDLTNYFGGELSNIQIWNTVLTEADALSIYNNGQPNTTAFGSPVSWWKLDNTTTGIQDSGSASNNGTNNGATEIQTNVWTPRLNGESTTLPTSALTSSDLQFESPYSNFSLNFDGTGDYIDCGSPSLFDDLTSFSFSCWFNSNVKSNDDGILGKWLSSTNRSFALNLETSGNIRFAVFNSGGTAAQSYINTSDWSTGNWYNVIGTYDGSNVKLYLDGVLKDTVALTGTVRNSTQSFRIGRYGSSSDFQGKIDETAIWNSALTQAQVSQVYNNGFAADLTSLSPISWWRLGEDAYFVGNDITIPNQISGAPNGTGAGTMTSMLVANAPGSYGSGVGTNLEDTDRKGEAPESSANSQSINMIPGDVHPYIPGYVPAQVNNVASMNFDGINDYFDAGSSLGIIGSNAYTFSAWLKTSYTGGIQTILSTRDQSADNGWVLQINNTSIQFFNEKNNTNIYTENNPTLTDGVWHNIVIVRGGSTATNAIYQDGSPITLTINTENGTSPQSASNLSIGSTITSASSPRFFDGNIDELAIFNYALTPKQIKEDIYNASTTGQTADLNNNSNLTAPVAWYRMGD